MTGNKPVTILLMNSIQYNIDLCCLLQTWKLHM